MFLQALQSGGGFLDNVEMGIELVDMGTVVNSSDGLSDSEEQTLLGGGKGHEAAPAVGRPRAGSMMDQASETVDEDFGPIGTF